MKKIKNAKNIQYCDHPELFSLVNLNQGEVINVSNLNSGTSYFLIKKSRNFFICEVEKNALNAHAQVYDLYSESKYACANRNNFITISNKARLNKDFFEIFSELAQAQDLLNANSRYFK